MATIRAATRYLTFPVTLALAAGCSSGGGGDGADAGTDTAGDPNVTPEDGGVVVSDDGKLTLTVPPGAVNEPVAITIARLPPGAAGTMTDIGYDASPDGLVFNLPARLQLDLTNAEAGVTDTTALDLLMLGSTSADGTREFLNNLAIDYDLAAATVSVAADVEHFTEWGLSALGPLVLEIQPELYVGPVGEEFDATLFVDLRATIDPFLVDLFEERGIPNPPTIDVDYRLAEGTGSVVALDPRDRMTPIDFDDLLAVGETLLLGNTFALRDAPFLCQSQGEGTYALAIGFTFRENVNDGLQLMGSVAASGDAFCQGEPPPPPEVTEGPEMVLDMGEDHAMLPGDDMKFGGGDGTTRFVLAGAGTALYNAATAAVIEQWPDPTETFFSIIALRMNGALGPNDAIVAGGSDGVAVRTYTDGIGFSDFQTRVGAGINVTDVVAMPEQNGLSAGFWWVDNTNSAVNSFSSVQQLPPRWSSIEIGMTGATGRAVSFNPGDGMTPDFVLTTEELLVETGGFLNLVPFLVSPSGGFRDFVRDGNTCVVSDFPTRVIAFDCQNPMIQDEIMVGGPVGLDIRGNRILASGSMDGTIHDITFDGNMATETVHDVSDRVPNPTWIRWYPGDNRASFTGAGLYGTHPLD